MENKELDRIVQEITGRDDYKIVKPWFEKVYRLEEKGPGFISEISREVGKAGRAALAGLALATASIPAQSVLDHLVPKYNIVQEAKANSLEDYKFGETQALVLGANMIIDGTIAGVGAKIHHKPFWKNFAYGAGTGIMIYGGKEIAIHTDVDGMPWLGRLVHSGGVSIRDNLSLGKDPLGRYQLDFGPLLFSFEKGRGYRPKVFILPGSIINVSLIASTGVDFDTEKTLLSGVPTFTFNANEKEFPNWVHKLSGGRKFTGFSKGNILAFDTSGSYDDEDMIWAHELTHAMQYREGTWLDGVWESKQILNGELGSKHMPWLGLKFGADTYLLGAGVIPQLTMPYEKRPFEFEAYHGFSRGMKSE